MLMNGATSSKRASNCWRSWLSEGPCLVGTLVVVVWCVFLCRFRILRSNSFRPAFLLIIVLSFFLSFLSFADVVMFVELVVDASSCIWAAALLDAKVRMWICQEEQVDVVGDAGVCRESEGVGSWDWWEWLIQVKFWVCLWWLVVGSKISLAPNTKGRLEIRLLVVLEEWILAIAPRRCIFTSVEQLGLDWGDDYMYYTYTCMVEPRTC